MFARCLIEMAEAEEDVMQLLPVKIIDELVFSLKIEDKAKLH